MKGYRDREGANNGRVNMFSQISECFFIGSTRAAADFIGSNDRGNEILSIVFKGEHRAAAFDSVREKPGLLY